MGIRWINSLLGTASASDVKNFQNIDTIDVRDLVDKAGNTSDTIKEKVQQGVELLRSGCRVVVFCDYGMSRSNAIATGILSVFKKINFEDALNIVQNSTGEKQIKLGPLNEVRAALDLMKEKRIKDEKRSIFITGGSGFLGRALITQLKNEDGFKIIHPAHSQIDIGLGSTQLDSLARKENVEFIVHFANPRVYTSNTALGQTLTMLRNVIDVCLSQNIRLIYPSGWEIYSGYAGVLKASESTPAFPRGPYGEAKYLAEYLIDHFRCTAGLQCVVLRSSPVYGLGSDKPKFIYNFIEKAINFENIVTHRYKNGDPSLDLLYIDDLISVLIKVINKDFIGDLNIGTGTLTSTLQIAQMIVKKMNSTSKVEQRYIDTDVASIAMDWALAKTELSWEPTMTVEKGIDHILSEKYDGK